MRFANFPCGVWSVPKPRSFQLLVHKVATRFSACNSWNINQSKNHLQGELQRRNLLCNTVEHIWRYVPKSSWHFDRIAELDYVCFSSVCADVVRTRRLARLTTQVAAHVRDESAYAGHRRWYGDRDGHARATYKGRVSQPCQATDALCHSQTTSLARLRYFCASLPFKSSSCFLSPLCWLSSVSFHSHHSPFLHPCSSTYLFPPLI